MRADKSGLCLLLAVGALARCHAPGLPENPIAAGDLDGVCRFDPHAAVDGAVLAFTVGHDLRFVFADGSTRTVYTFASLLPSPDTSFIARVDDVKADRVIADGSTYESPTGQPATFASELVLLDRQGNVIWHATADGFGTAQLGSDGTLGLWDHRSQATLVVAPDGTTRAIAGKWSPVAPAPDGSILVQDPPPGGDGRLGWLRPGRQSVEMLAIEPTGSVEWVADRLIYVGKKDGQEVLVSATPETSGVVALPGDSGGGLSIAGVGSEWIELQRSQASASTVDRVDVRTGAVDELQPQRPPGMRAFDAGSAFPQLADDGSLLAGFRNDSVGYLYRSTDLGASWQPVGFSVARVQGLDVMTSSRGTFVAQAVQSVYAPASPWAAPSGAVVPDLSGPFVEIARPADGVRYQLPPLSGSKPVALGDAGRCAAYWIGASATTRQLEALDVVHGKRTTLGTSDDLHSAQAPLWLVP